MSKKATFFSFQQFGRYFVQYRYLPSMTEIRTLLHRARTFLLNDLQGALVVSSWLRKDQCIDECGGGLFSHLPGADDLDKFALFNPALFRREKYQNTSINSPLINNKFMPVHLAISFNYENGEFVWDETGNIVENG